MLHEVMDLHENDAKSPSKPLTSHSVSILIIFLQ